MVRYARSFRAGSVAIRSQCSRQLLPWLPPFRDTWPATSRDGRRGSEPRCVTRSYCDWTRCEWAVNGSRELLPAPDTSPERVLRRDELHWHLGDEAEEPLRAVLHAALLRGRV